MKRTLLGLIAGICFAVLTALAQNPEISVGVPVTGGSGGGSGTVGPGTVGAIPKFATTTTITDSVPGTDYTKTVTGANGVSCSNVVGDVTCQSDLAVSVLKSTSTGTPPGTGHLYGHIMIGDTSTSPRPYICLADDGTDCINVSRLTPASSLPRGFTVTLDGGGSAITTGLKTELQMPYACTITSWSILLDQSGSIVIDLWKDTEANYPPLVGDTITASAKPTVSSATKASSSTLTGWTTSIAAGDTIKVNVDSITTATRATLNVNCSI